MNTVIHADNLTALNTLESNSIDLIYIDPPFNTGKVRKYNRLKTTRTSQTDADRRGFQGKYYKSTVVDSQEYDDTFSDYMSFLKPRLVEGYRVLQPSGSFFLHLDYREVHYARLLLDQLFGKDSFKNEIIWAYDFGGRSKTSWPAKHDNILWYAKDPDDYTFNFDEMDRIPYMAPGLVGKKKAERGKTPTDVWWHTIVPTNGKERTGYPTQKPLGILNRIIKVHSNRGDTVLDYFAGSGTTGEAAALNGRRFILIDSNRDAIDVMGKRLAAYEPTFVGADVKNDEPVQKRLSL